MSSSFGGGQGQIRYVISVDDAQAVQKLQSVGQQFQTLGNSTTQLQQGVQQLAPTLDQASQSTGQFSQANADLAAELSATDIGVKEVTESNKSFGQVVKSNIANIIQIGTGITGLVGNYLSLQRQQIAINRLELMHETTLFKVDKAQRKYNDAVAKFGPNSVEAQDALRTLNILKEKESVQSEQLALRNEQLTMSYVNLGLSGVQTAVGIVQAVTSLKTYKAAADVATVSTNALSMSMNRLKIAAVITAILVGIEIAAQAVAHNFMCWIT